MQAPIKMQEEAKSRALKYRDTDNGLFKIGLSLLVVGMAIVISILYGEALVKHLSPDNMYTSNQVEIIKQDTQVINARLTEQRESIHSMEIRFVDQNRSNQERFTELETKVAQLEEQIQQITLANQYKEHRVVRGETLWRISMQYYGTGRYVDDLARYNNLTNPRLIVSGTVIKIPPVTNFN
ncbi:LysM peptidoglycan-binding domain-containing protein [Desulfuribacillus alkaliarsenatis]|uniref:LysM domain-containing protein n=1 Tax=Desulfuribacillus alkaliarsenatis TaxID=766136 RepID=A0A1E5G5R9_9FIRM|nr:LysM peptidoglycan-binding domain-containing protein [Desulfuribacillus alkaliarsenatis]OEF98518.1 hypothetical protein BHF68_02315 [Desulfuribacillus alkaliarsenatis]